MEFRHLRYFVAVAEELSFRRAADRLRIAQPALSRQVKDLEHELGVQLLDRNTARVRLTDAGALYLAEAKDILARVFEAATAAREAAVGRRGTLTIGNAGPLTASFIPASLSAFRQKYPDVDVSLLEVRLPDQITALENGLIQIGLTAAPVETIPAHVHRMLVLESPLCVYFNRNHPLAAKSRINLAELQEEKWLAVSEGPRLSVHAEHVRAMFANRGLQLLPPKYIDSPESLTAMVAGDQGITYAPDSFSMHRSEGIISRPIRQTGPDLVLSLWAVWLGASASQLVKNFIEVIRELKGSP